MPTTIPVNLFSSEAVLVFFKASTLIILFLYAIFALMIVRQVELMGKTLITGISPAVKIIAAVHALSAIGLIILAWWIL